jgi:hypothetical protein
VKLSPQCRTYQRMALDGKLGPRTLILLSAVWAADPGTFDSRGEQLTYRVAMPRVSTCICTI